MGGLRMMLPIEVVAQHYHGILRSVPSEPYLVGFSDLQMIALDAHLLGQAEFRTDPVVRLYQACFGRVPDSDGLDFWVAVYKIRIQSRRSQTRSQPRTSFRNNMRV